MRKKWEELIKVQPLKIGKLNQLSKVIKEAIKDKVKQIAH